jgi:hypothetical protein
MFISALPRTVCLFGHWHGHGQKAHLSPVFKGTINLVFSLFDCHRSTYESHARLAFASAQINFPSPTTVISQLNDGVFHSFVFHGILRI